MSWPRHALFFATLVLCSAAGPAAGEPPCQPFDLSLDVEQVLLDLEHGPSIQEVQSWAVGQAMVAPRRAERLLRDARARGALPLVRIRGRYKDSSGRKWDDLDLLDSRDRDLDYTVDVWVEWDLAELAASTDTYRATREARAITELRQGVLTQVAIAFFDRRRLLAEGRMAPSDEAVDRAVVRRLRVQELDATLDALTGGRWTAALRRVRPARASPLRPDPRATRSASDPGQEATHPGTRTDERQGASEGE